MKLRALLAAILLGACDGTPAESPLVFATVHPTRAYAGSEVAVVSRSFASMPNVAILSGPDVLPITRRSGDSVFVRLPTDVRGHYPLRIGTGSQPVGSVDVAGFVAHETHDLNAWAPEVWPRGGRASVIGGNGTALMRLLPGPNTVSVLVPNVAVGFANQRMPGLTPWPSRLLLQPSGGVVGIWEMLPQAQLIGTIPTQTGYMIHQISDSLFMELISGRVRISHLRNGVFQTVSETTIQYGDPQRIVMSPRRDLVALADVSTSSARGLPVFRTATGQLAFEVPGFSHFNSVKFSASGDTLWVLAAPESEAVVLALNANTGAELGRIQFGGSRAIALALDPDADRLFVATHSNAELTSLHVVDTKTLKVTARVRAPTVSCCPAVVAVGADGVFVVGNWDLLKFDYLR